MNPTPFKEDAIRSPLRDLIYIQDNAKYIRIDPAHTYAIEGIGKSFLASCIIVTMKMGVWGAGSIESRFQNAYASFMSFCDAYSFSTTIYEFSYKASRCRRGRCSTACLAV